MAGVISVIADAAAIDATGVKVTYTVPTVERAEISSYSMFSAGTLFIWDLEVVRGASTITIFRSTAAQSKSVDTAKIPLQGGDVVNMRISTVGAGGNTGDFLLGIRLP
jgi:hypothetical protein